MKKSPLRCVQLLVSAELPVCTARAPPMLCPTKMTGPLPPSFSMIWLTTAVTSSAMVSASKTVSWSPSENGKNECWVTTEKTHFSRTDLRRQYPRDPASRQPVCGSERSLSGFWPLAPKSIRSNHRRVVTPQPPTLQKFWKMYGSFCFRH